MPAVAALRLAMPVVPPTLLGRAFGRRIAPRSSIG